MGNSALRLTSEGIYVEFLPRSLVEATHIETFAFDSAVDGGTFKIWYNGEITADITFSDTEATLVTNVNAALDALDNTTAGDLVFSGTDIIDMTLTATGLGNAYVAILIRDEALTQTTPNSNLKLVRTVTTQGAAWVRVSEEFSAFDFDASVDTVDVTTISEYFRTMKAVAEGLSGTASFYKNKIDTSVIQTQLAMASGNTGWLRIFPEGKVVGNEVISFEILVTNFGEDYPDHEKVEQECGFERLGEWIDYPSTVWRV